MVTEHEAGPARVGVPGFTEDWNSAEEGEQNQEGKVTQMGGVQGTMRGQQNGRFLGKRGVPEVT